jgi:hypothetical protein
LNVLRLPQLDLDALAAPRPEGQWALAWRRLKRDRFAMACGVFLLVILFAVGPGARLYAKVAAAAIIFLNLLADLVLIAVDPTVTLRGRGFQRFGFGRAA